MALVTLATAYGVGLRRLWRSGVPRGVDHRRVASFASGTAVLALALTGRVAGVAGELFSVHMVQHLALTLVAAPLLLAGRPLTVLRFALPVSLRRRLARPERRAAERLGTGAAVAAVAGYVGTTLVWHVPALWEAAVRSPALHAVEHVTLLAGGALFWTVVGIGRRDPGPVGALAAFAAALGLGALGAGLSLTGTVWYGVHAGGHGLTPLADQHLAGAVMWVPGGLVHVAAAVALVVGWLDGDARRPAAS